MVLDSTLHVEKALLVGEIVLKVIEDVTSATLQEIDVPAARILGS
jgi:hypothetical protein